MTKCSAFSTHQTLFDVFQIFRKVVARYCEVLNGQLPAKVAAPLPTESIQAVCYVIGTAEYCDAMLPMLSDSIRKVIDPAFDARVSFNAEQDLAVNTISKAMQVLVQSVSSSLDEVFQKMTKTNWASFNSVVADQSPYVS